MSGHSQGPDPQTGLMDGLRALRHLARQGRHHMRTFGPDRLMPAPLSGYAHGALSQVDEVASAIGRQTEEMIRQLVRSRPVPSRPLEAFQAETEAAEEFAAAAYAGLRRALTAFGAQEVLVLESAAQTAFRAAWIEGAPDQNMFAARLTLGMLETHVVRDVITGPGTDLPAHEIAPLACFAVVMWLCCERDTSDDAEMIATCVSLALGLRSEILAGLGDRAALSQLFAEFRHHV